MASTTRVPVFGTSKSASKSVSLVEIKRDGAGLIQTHKTCDFRVLEDSKFIKMIFPDKFVAALARHTYPLQFDKDAQGWRYRADLGIERIGYKSNGNETALPAKIDDPAVYDWDGDGKPAATLKISIPLLPNGEFYVVQRGHSILNGRDRPTRKNRGRHRNPLVRTARARRVARLFESIGRGRTRPKGKPLCSEPDRCR